MEAAGWRGRDGKWWMGAVLVCALLVSQSASLEARGRLGGCFGSISRGCEWVAALLAAMHPVLNRPCPLSRPPTMQ